MTQLGEEREGKQRGLQHHQQHQQMEGSRQHQQRGHQPTYMWDLLMGEEEGGPAWSPLKRYALLMYVGEGGMLIITQLTWSQAGTMTWLGEERGGKQRGLQHHQQRQQMERSRQHL